MPPLRNAIDAPFSSTAVGVSPSVVNIQPTPVYVKSNPCAVIVRLPPLSPARVVNPSTETVWLFVVGSSSSLISPPSVKRCW